MHFQIVASRRGSFPAGPAQEISSIISRSLLFGAFAGSAVAGSTQKAPETTPLTYNDGDLFLAFRATDRTQDYLVNIGQPTQFVNAAPGSTFSVTMGNTSIDLIAAFGFDWHTRIDSSTGVNAVLWAVIGGRRSQPRAIRATRFTRPIRNRILGQPTPIPRNPSPRV